MVDFSPIWVYTYIIEMKEVSNMTKAERNAIKARTEELVKEGIEKELAKVMAKVELETGLIKVVVNYND